MTRFPSRDRGSQRGGAARLRPSRCPRRLRPPQSRRRPHSRRGPTRHTNLTRSVGAGDLSYDRVGFACRMGAQACAQPDADFAETAVLRPPGIRMTETTSPPPLALSESPGRAGHIRSCAPRGAHPRGDGHARPGRLDPGHRRGRLGRVRDRQRHGLARGRRASRSPVASGPARSARELGQSAAGLHVRLVMARGSVRFVPAAVRIQPLSLSSSCSRSWAASSIALWRHSDAR